MSELISSVNLKKSDGSPLKVNFQFENGLPAKPTLYPLYQTGSHKGNHKKVCVIHLSKENEILFKNENLEEIFYEHINNTLNAWLIFNSFYIFLNNINSEFEDFYLIVLDHKKNYLKRCFLNGN